MSYHMVYVTNDAFAKMFGLDQSSLYSYCYGWDEHIKVHYFQSLSHKRTIRSKVQHADTDLSPYFTVFRWYNQ